MTKIRVVGPYCFVRRLDTPELTESGLYILGREKPQIGLCIAAGKMPDGSRPIREGDYVIFPKGHDWFIDLQKYGIDGEVLWMHLTVPYAVITSRED